MEMYGGDMHFTNKSRQINLPKNGFTFYEKLILISNSLVN